jgi:site-specific recombinase XerD
MTNAISKPQANTLTTRTDYAALVTAWQAELLERVQAQEISADTAASYQRGVNKFLAWHAGEATGETIRTWKAELLAARIKPASINAWLAGLRSFFGWLAQSNQIPFDPTQAIKGASRKGTKKRHTRQALTDKEVLRLLAQPDRDTPQGKRDYAMLAVMLFTAARGVELHRADLADLHTEGGKLVLMVQGKGHTEKDELVVLTEEAEDAVRDWLAVRGKKPGPLFVSLSNRTHYARLSRRALREIIKGHMSTAGIHGEEKTTHSLRHTAISSAIRHGAPAEKVKGMSRHASLDTLMIYYHETDRIDDPAESYISYKGTR